MRGVCGPSRDSDNPTTLMTAVRVISVSNHLRLANAGGSFELRASDLDCRSFRAGSHNHAWGLFATLPQFRHGFLNQLQFHFIHLETVADVAQQGNGEPPAEVFAEFLQARQQFLAL